MKITESLESHIHGMLTLEKLQEHANAETIHTVLMVFTDLYGRLLGKRIDVDFFLDNAAQSGVGACNYLLSVDMDMDVIPGYDYANWQKGFGDFHLQADLQSLRVAHWLDGTAMVICDVTESGAEEYVTIAPRSMLRKQLAALEAIGYSAQSASELEYYLFENSFKQAAINHYHNLGPVGWYIEDYHILQGTREEHFNAKARIALKKSGIPVETSKGEYGHGQHELNVRYADMLTMADRHVIFKQCLKEIADAQDMSVTFMAKFAEDQAGSSCHLHVSLWQDEQNAFSQNDDIFRWFLGGWMHHAAELMLFYAPTINSYKRYQNASWAPTQLAWSTDNRTAGFRIIGKGTNGYRIECRLPGADCNPYLAFAAALASGIDGIKNKIEPPEEFHGDVYAANNLTVLPASLTEAVDSLANSDFAKTSFGEEVVAHYVHFGKTEIAKYQSAVTDWERKRYFEQI